MSCSNQCRFFSSSANYQVSFSLNRFVYMVSLHLIEDTIGERKCRLFVTMTTLVAAVAACIVQVLFDQLRAGTAYAFATGLVISPGLLQSVPF